MPNNFQVLDAAELTRRLDAVEQALHPGGRRIDWDTPNARDICGQAIEELDSLRRSAWNVSLSGDREPQERQKQLSGLAHHVHLICTLCDADREAAIRRRQNESDLAAVEATLAALASRRAELLAVYAAAADEISATRIRREGFQVVSKIAEARTRRLALMETLGVITPSAAFSEELGIDAERERATRGLRDCERRLRSAG